MTPAKLPKVYVECYNDQALILSTGHPRNRVAHERDKGRVVKRVVKGLGQIGLIDEDPGKSQPKSLDGFHVVDAAYGLKLMKGRDDNQQLIIVSPDLENWLVERAKTVDSMPTKFGLPDDPKTLHGISQLHLDSRFLDFLESLNGDDGFLKLKEWIASD